MRLEERLDVLPLAAAVPRRTSGSLRNFSPPDLDTYAVETSEPSVLSMDDVVDTLGRTVAVDNLLVESGLRGGSSVGGGEGQDEATDLDLAAATGDI